MSFSVCPRSVAISAKVAPLAMRSAVAVASSEVVKTICWMLRFSGVTKRARRSS